MSANRKKKQEAEKRRREQWKKRAFNATLTPSPSGTPFIMPSDSRLVTPPAGLPKMSDLLTELADPYLAECNDEVVAVEKTISLTVAAWNVAVSGPKAGAELIKSLLSTIPEADQVTVAAILANLVHRKMQMFPNDRRLVHDFKVYDRPEGPYLEVMSILDKAGS